MRIALDLDGVIVDGSTYFPEERRGSDLYLGLPPYDGDTVEIYNRLCRKHEVYIVTARHYREALGDICHWLTNFSATTPAGILTHIPPKDKLYAAWGIGCTMMVDDHPKLYAEVGQDPLVDGVSFYLMNNPGWPENLRVPCTNRINSWKELEKVIDERTDLK